MKKTEAFLKISELLKSILGRDLTPEEAKKSEEADKAIAPTIAPTVTPTVTPTIMPQQKPNAGVSPDFSQFANELAEMKTLIAQAIEYGKKSEERAVSAENALKSQNEAEQAKKIADEIKKLKDGGVIPADNEKEAERWQSLYSKDFDNATQIATGILAAKTPQTTRAQQTQTQTPQTQQQGLSGFPRINAGNEKMNTLKNEAIAAVNSVANGGRNAV